MSSATKQILITVAGAVAAAYTIKLLKNKGLL